MPNTKLFALLLALTACTSVKSSSVVTEAMTPEFSAIADGDQLVVQAQFRVDGSDSATFIELAEGDRLKVIYGDSEQELNTELFGTMYRYQTTFDLSEGREDIRFVFERADGTIAENNIVSIPLLFDMESPVDTTILTREDSLDIRWRAEDSEDKLHILIDGMCLDAHKDVVDISQGEYPIPVYALHWNILADEGESCELTITLERRAEGSLDPVFEEGSIYSAQRQSRVVTIQL